MGQLGTVYFQSELVKDPIILLSPTWWGMPLIPALREFQASQPPVSKIKTELDKALFLLAQEWGGCSMTPKGFCKSAYNPSLWGGRRIKSSGLVEHIFIPST